MREHLRLGDGQRAASSHHSPTGNDAVACGKTKLILNSVVRTPALAGIKQKDDQHAEGEGQNIICAVGSAAQMQKEDEVNADLREGEYAG